MADNQEQNFDIAVNYPVYGHVKVMAQTRAEAQAKAVVGEAWYNGFIRSHEGPIRLNERLVNV